MGYGLIISVLGASAATHLLMLSLNSNASLGVGSSIDYFDETQARLISNSAIEIYLEQLRRNKNLYGEFLNNKLFGGTYNVTITGVDSLMIIRAEGFFGEVKHISVATARRSTITIPGTDGGVYVSSDNLNLNLAGNVEINGNDTNLDGTPGPNPPIPGISVDNTADSLNIVNNIKGKISKPIIGAGGTPSIGVTSATTNWMSAAENFIFAADTALSSGTYSTGTQLGTAASPKITYAKGDVNFSGSAEGYGILIVNGNLSMSGNFTFRGLVIVYGESSIHTKTVGNSGIYGASVFVGQSVDIQASGNSSFFYSSQAINLAKQNLKSSRFEILSWWE